MEEVDWDGQDAVFEAEMAKGRVKLNRHLYEVMRAEDTLEKLSVLKEISFDFIQHNNPGWRELVSVFRTEELYGRSTPSWAESATTGIRDYRGLRRGKDSLPGVHEG